MNRWIQTKFPYRNVTISSIILLAILFRFFDVPVLAPKDLN